MIATLAPLLFAIAALVSLLVIADSARGLVLAWRALWEDS